MNGRGRRFSARAGISVLDLDPLLAGRVIFDQRQLLGVDRDVVFLREAEIAGDALEPLDGVEPLLQVRRLGRLRVVDHLRQHHDAVVARFGERRRIDVELLLVFLAERRELRARMEIGGEHGADRAVGDVARELRKGVVGVGLVIAEDGGVVAGRMQVLHEGRLVLRREPRVNAFDARRLGGVDLGHEAGGRAGRPVLGDRVVDSDLFAGFVVRELDAIKSALTISRRIMQDRDSVGTVLERVFADLLAPGESVEAEVEHPRVRRSVRPLGVDGEAAVVDDADGRELVPDRKLRRDRTGVRGTGDRDRPGGDELLVQLPGDRRRRIVIMRIELELTAKHAARGVDLVDRHLRAVDGRDARRPVCAGRSGDEADEIWLPGGAGRSLCSG